MSSKPARNERQPPESPEQGSANPEYTRAVVSAAEQAVVNEQEALESGEESPG
jgi:hypothetical protein